MDFFQKNSKCLWLTYFTMFMPSKYEKTYGLMVLYFHVPIHGFFNGYFNQKIPINNRHKKDHLVNLNKSI
jgi:hypothetical protein